MKRKGMPLFKKILAGGLVTSMLTFSSVMCFGVSIDDLDINSGAMEISGSAGEDEMVLVEIFKGNLTESDYPTDLIYILQKDAENGKYKFEFNVLNAAKGETGEFTARVSGFSGQAETKTFYFYTEEETDVLREEINGHIQNTEKDSADISWLEDYFKTNKNNLIPSYVPFDKVFENGHTTNFSELYSYEEKSADNAAMRASVRKISLLTMLGHSSADEIYELLEKYGADLQIKDKQSYVTYAELNEESRKSVADMLYEFARPYDTENDFIESFDTAVIITKLAQINGTTACKNVLAGYPEYFDLSKATTDHYKDILKGITNGNIVSIDDITDILGADYEGDDNGNGGGSRGSGGSGSKASASFDSSKANQSNAETYKPEPVKDFTDLGDFEWAVESINYLRNKGIINGYSDEVFAPADNVTRAQLCKMLCLALNLNSYDKDGVSFDDVNKDDWHYDYIATLSALGIVNGTGDNVFEPDKNVTREDMAVMAYRAMKVKNISFEISSKLSFNDADLISDYAIEAVSALGGEKILSGDDKGNFNPKNNANRAEAAKFIHSVCIKCGGAE